ncbi:MAG: sigma-70 family RNA polymerase sigma factor [Planctomycetota bacterium]
MSDSDANTSDFQALVDPHLDALHRTAVRLTRDANEAEDLVQETLLKSFRSIHHFQANSNFKAWIFRILMNTFINGYRKKKHRGIEVELENALEPEAEESNAGPVVSGLLEDGGEEELAGVLDMVDERVSQAVMDLPENLRTVFTLSVLEDLKYREIADILDCPVGTVMSRLFRGRALLKERLQHYASEEGYLRG